MHMMSCILTPFQLETLSFTNLLELSIGRGFGALQQCIICVYHLGLCVCFSWGIPQLQSDWSLSCDHGLDYAS